MDVQPFDSSSPLSRMQAPEPHIDSLSPDELFAKYTVVEVKAFQTRLRSSRSLFETPSVVDSEVNIGLMLTQNKRNYDSWLGK
jgi:hypothetical protein